MVVYKLGYSIGRDEEDFTNILFNRPTRYKPFNLDYNTQFKPKLLLEQMASVVSLLEDVFPIPKDFFISIAIEISKILEDCISSSFNNLKQALIFKEDAWLCPIETKRVLEACSKEKGLSGWLADLKLNRAPKGKSLRNYILDLENKEFYGDKSDKANEKRRDFLDLLAFLSVIDTKVVFNDNIPKSMYEKVKVFLLVMILYLAKAHMADFPEELFQKIKYEEPKQSNPEEIAFCVEKIEGIRIVDNVLIINGFEFRTNKDKKFLEEFTGFLNKNSLRWIFFQDCCFNSDTLYFWNVSTRISFHNCRFEKIFSVLSTLNSSLEFNECTFLAALNLERTAFNQFSALHIEKCFFEKGSICNLSKIYKFQADGSTLFNSITIEVKDTIFNGELKLQNTRNEICLRMENVSFGYPFQIHNIKLEKHSKLENLCFSSIPSIQMNEARKDLYNAMKNAGLEERAKELGILAEKQEEPNSKFDYDKYQLAYESGYLKPEYAAYFLGKSVNYLAKKRAKDKEQITREALPFIGKGKDIQYPVDALLAFKAKDWVKLKELRKKYEMNEEEKED